MTSTMSALRSKSKSGKVPRDYRSCTMCGEFFIEKCEKDVLSALENEITAYFVGVKILEFSNSHCVDLLKLGSGKSPHSWFDFCNNCFKKIIQAEKTFKRFLKIETEWKSLKFDLYCQICRYYDKNKAFQNFREQNIFHISEENDNYTNVNDDTFSSVDNTEFFKLEELEIKLEDDAEFAAPDDSSQSDEEKSEEVNPYSLRSKEKNDSQLAGVEKPTVNISGSLQKKKAFTEEETNTLVQIWCSSKFQKAFKKRPHDHIWKSITMELYEAGQQEGKEDCFPQRNIKEVRFKMKRVKRRYYAYKNGAVKRWVSYFKILEEALKYRARMKQTSSKTCNTEVVSKVKRFPNFSKTETRALMELWSSEEIQNNFRDAVTHGPVWKLLAVELYKKGKENPPGSQFPQRGGLEVLRRIQKVKSKYTALKSNNPNVVQRGKPIPYYELFEKVYGNHTTNDGTSATMTENIADEERFSTCPLRSESDSEYQCDDDESLEDTEDSNSRDSSSEENHKGKLTEGETSTSKPSSEKEMASDMNENKGENSFHRRKTPIVKAGKSEDSETRKNSPIFSHEETKALLKLWSHDKYQNLFSQKKTHVFIWTHMAKELFESGKTEDGTPQFPNREFRDLKNRIRNLKQIYTATKYCYLITDKECFPYYEVFENVLGHRQQSISAAVAKSTEDCDELNGTKDAKALEIGNSAVPHKGEPANGNGISKPTTSSDVDMPNKPESQGNEQNSASQGNTSKEIIIRSSDFIIEPRSKRGPNFTHEETKALLNIWSNDKHQKVFSTTTRKHASIWKKIATELYQVGINEEGKARFPERDFLELQTRVKNLKRRYTVLKSDTTVDDFPYYEVFENIFDHRPQSASSVNVSGNAS